MTTAESFDRLLTDHNTFCHFSGIHITKIAPGYCQAQCRMESHHTNPYGTAHGGLLFTMLDTAGCSAASAAEGGHRRMLVTQNASIYYLRAAKPGVLRAEAHTVKSGRNMALVSIDIFDGEDRHIARGELTAFYTGEVCEVPEDCDTPEKER